MNLEISIHNAKILIVDDEPINIRILQKALHRENYQCIDTTTDPREVDALYRKNFYDLVLLDIQMPYLDGFSVMKQLKTIDAQRKTYSPVLVLTAQTDRETRLKALQQGAKDFLTKPFDMTEALHRIYNLLEVKLLHNQAYHQNKILEQKVRHRTDALNQTRLEIIHRLGRAAEYRDNETGLHIIRMSRYSQLLGLKIGMIHEESETLLHASPMHDLGKIGIPDSILLKPGKLTKEEFDIMKQHPVIGSDILSGSNHELLSMAKTIALTHHERWDGSGYPHGIKGEAIPLHGRIVAICDVFDALTSERPYKKAWSVSETIDFMKQQSQKHFDPTLLRNFMDILPEILKIKTKYAEPHSSSPLLERY